MTSQARASRSSRPAQNPAHRGGRPDPLDPRPARRHAAGVLGDHRGQRRPAGPASGRQVRPPVQHRQSRRQRPARSRSTRPGTPTGPARSAAAAAGCASITAAPRRVTARRSASWAGVGSRSGARSNTSPARASTSASITSDLFFPLIAPRSRAACRDPSNDRPARGRQRHRQRQPGHRRRLGHRQHPGYSPSRSVTPQPGQRRRHHEPVRPHRPVRADPGRTPHDVAVIAASIPTRTTAPGLLLPWLTTRVHPICLHEEHGPHQPVRPGVPTNTGGPSSHARSLPPSSSPTQPAGAVAYSHACESSGATPEPAPASRTEPQAHQFPSTGTTAGRQAPDLTISFTSPKTHPKTATPGGPSQVTVVTTHTVTGTPYKRYKPLTRREGRERGV